MIRYFYCPTCGRIHAGKLDGEITTTDDNLCFDIYCWYKCSCGSDAVEIDHGLLMIIQNINKTKFKTRYCCEGHMYIQDSEKFYNNAYILFSQSVTMSMFNDIIGKHPLPQGWTIELTDETDEPDIQNCICIRYTNIDDDYGKLSENEFEIKKKFYLMELNRWVNNVLAEESDIIE